MKNKIYGSVSQYYDLLYSFINYEKQAEYIDSLIQKNKKNQNIKLLDAACGTGSHIQFLKEKYKIVAFDINKNILKHAIDKNKDVAFFQADMSSFKYKDSFGSIICMASSIGYLKTYQKLEKALKQFYLHLDVGGVLIIEPWNFNHQLGKNQNISMIVHNGNDIKIARGGVINKKGIISYCKDTFLIVEKGKPVKVFKDTNILAQFDEHKFLQMMKKIGFHAVVQETEELYSKKVYIGIKD